LSLHDLLEKIFIPYFFLQKIWQRKEIFSQEIWTDLGFAEAWDETQRQTNRPDGALNFFFGGDQVKTLETGSPRSVGQALLKRFNTVVPGAQKAATGKFVRTAWSRDLFTRRVLWVHEWRGPNRSPHSAGYFAS
jgi:monoamine oxidase